MEHKHGIDIQYIDPKHESECCTITIASGIRTRNLRDITKAVARTIDTMGYYRDHQGEKDCRWKERNGNRTITVTTYREE